MHILFFNPQGNFDDRDSHLTEHPDFGGQLIYVKEVAMAMVDQGHTADIVTRRIRDPEWPEFADDLDHYSGYEQGLRIVRIPCGGDEFLAKEKLWPQLPEFVANTVAFYGEDLPDCMTAHYADGGYCAALMQAETGLHFSFTGHSLGAQKLDKLGMNRSNYGELEERFRFSRRIAAERLSMQRASRIITSTGQERHEQYGHPLYSGAVDPADDSRFRVIPPGVNTRVFHADPAGDTEVHSRLAAKLRHPETPHLVISSRIDHKKNIGGAVRAFVESPELPRRAALAICVRGIDDPWSEAASLGAEERDVLLPILQQIDDAGLRDRVAFLNVGSQGELAATYRYFAGKGSVFVLPSLYEPFGLAPIEAVACGLACVATRNGGPAEIFADGSAVLVDPSNAQETAQGMLQALENFGELAPRSRQRVLSTYTWEMTAERYLDVLQEAVNTGPVRPASVPELNAQARLDSYLS